METQKVVYSPTPEIYLETDAATFKDLVQRHTGANGRDAHRLRPKANVSRRSPFKFQDRRKHSVRDLEIIKLGVESSENSPDNTRSNENFLPVKVPTERDLMTHAREVTYSPPSKEERAIVEKGFFLHASPRKAEPLVLLSLFPLTS